MTDFLYAISVEELAEARNFFQNSPQSELALTATKFNQEQPYFSATGEAWQRMGVPQFAVKELLQSIFEMYYVVTVIHGKMIKTIDISDIQKGADLLGALSKFHFNNNSAKSINGNLTTTYFQNSAVFEHAIDAMYRAFGDLETIVEYCESLAVYNALLRAIASAE